MSTATTLPVVIGQRVKVTRCSPTDVIDRIGIVKRAYSDTQAYVKLEDGYDGPHNNGEWIIDGWEPLEGVESVHRDNVLGMTLIAKFVPGFPENHDKEFTVIEVHEQTQEAWTRGLCVKGTFGHDDLWVHEWDVPGPDPKDAEIARLKHELERSNERLREVQGHYQHDLSAINRLANDEADQQDWCSTYEDTLDAMNRVLTGGFVLEGRSFDFTVEAWEEVTVRVRRSWSGQARSAEAAKEAASDYFDENDLSDDDVIDALREYAEPSYSSRDEQYRWTVEKD